MKALIESNKSKLVKSLKIEDSHIRKFNKSDKHVCYVCARAKITQMTFKKVHAVRQKSLGDCIIVEIAVFINCPSRESYRYVVQFLDHAIKHSWVYPMLQFEMAKDESTVESFEHFVGIRYRDDESLLDFVTTRVVILQGVIVAYCAPVNKYGRVGFEE